MENIMENNFEFADTTRRDVLRKAVFVTPLILTLPVFPSFAKAGSNGGDERDDAANTGGYQSENHRRRRHHHGFWAIFGA